MAGIGWDTSSAVEGAAASGGNPYAAAALFVIGGVLGGMKKKRIKKQQKWARQHMREAMDPKFLAKLTGQHLPLQRQLIAQGAGSQIQSNIASNIAAHGGTGTGLALTLKNMGETAPGVAAFNNALSLGREDQLARIQHYANKAGMASNALNAPGGFNPGFGNALMGLYGIGSGIYKDYQAARGGQGAMAEFSPGSSISPNFNPDIYGPGGLFPVRPRGYAL